MNSQLPNFLIVGAARSGTSALYSFMVQHPEVFGPNQKEPNFLAFAGRSLRFTGPGDAETINRRAVTDEREYARLFDGVRTEKAIGEASVSSLYFEEALINIRRFLGTPKIIVILREPVARAFSNFQYMRSYAREPLSSFDEALQQEEERIRAGWHHIWHYRNLGYYYKQLSRFYDQLGADQIHAICYDEFRAQPAATLREVFEFLGVDPGVEIRTDYEVNISGRPKSEPLARAFVRSSPLKRVAVSLLPESMRRRLVTWLRQKLLVKEEVPEEARVRLNEEYRSEILALQKLINKDLEKWLDPDT
jgi:hypothetical protein